jgi:hypothetical protein
METPSISVSKILFSSYLDFLTMDEVHKPSDSKPYVSH